MIQYSKMILTFLIATGLGTASAQNANDPVIPATTNAYPTPIVVEYVMGCMQANGQNLDSLTRCSCSIDYIAQNLPYRQYEEADTVLRVQLDQGQRGAAFRSQQWAKDIVDRLQDVQAASSLECF